MMDPQITDILKVLAVVLSPVGALLVWLLKKHHMKVENLAQRVTDVEKASAITQVMLDNIRDDIREIKMGIEKILDKK